VLNDFKNAFQRQNHAHVQLIIINVVVFAVIGLIHVVFTLTEFGGIAEGISKQFSVPSNFGLFLNRPWTIITYAFQHGGFMHIIFNMLALYWFGQLFVEYLGSDKLVALYVLGAVVGAIFYLLAFNLIPFYQKTFPSNLELVGASAAIDAIVVAAATLLPDYTFYLLLLGPVRIKYIALVTVLLSLLGTVESNAGGNIAHLGGALIGFIYIKQLQAGVNWGGWITVTLDWFKGLFTSKPKVKVTYRKEAPTPKTSGGAGKASQDEIDKILDKISDRGYESLSKEEKEKLFNASKK
jgi:membrane associated rhomboid family serine protease